jgi:LPXTG-motif cell wall-anchored protein
MGRIAAVLGAMAFASARAEAGLIIDQEQLKSEAFADIKAAGPTGQTFTPSLPGIQFAIFKLSDTAFSGGTVSVELHAGVNGAMLATSGPVNLAAGFGGSSGADVEFDFASRITLAPGTKYSLILKGVSGDDFRLWATNSSTYGGGAAIVFGQELSSTESFYFKEGLVATPEPSSLALAGGAVLIGGGAWWRRRRRSVNA